MNELYHHGILGQKWGIRRYQNKDGSLTEAGKLRYGTRNLDSHTIKKGTVLYRVTPNKNEQNDNKSVYVSYTPIDRAKYLGPYFNQLRKYNDSDEMYEQQYVLNKDLKVPSRDETISVMESLTKKDPSFATNAAKQMVASATGQKLVNEFMKDPYYKNMTFAKLNQGYSMKDAEHSTKIEIGKDFTEQFAVDFGNNPVKWSTSIQYSLGGSEENRNKVIKELKKRGYNAMVDEAGYRTDSEQTGVEALIVFDGSNMSNKSTTPVTRKQRKQAMKLYREWDERIANRK